MNVVRMFISADRVKGQNHLGLECADVFHHTPRYLIDRRAAFSVVAEHNLNRLQTSQFRVFAMIDVDLWL